ncbi:integral membrane protein [Gaeumannomyces tritici R3-111a-1]|uniref:Integral membrane protein n=1 Tax=Gaeumannomyces tritici (strain R3-111a-1) TaxID=644352 RepID=J3NQG1_GAET3|nr:integral membrane protein [Gaeumannomyces tritici R3-111a-1]EJT78417.1 integral membrane protein [Gaeumannomyces tritici R3-111a-1]
MAGQSLFSLATCFAKLSILLSYIRIAPEHSLFRRFTWGSMALAVAIAVASLFALWLQCRPISTYWDLGEQAPVCLRESLLMFSLAVANVTTDLLLAVLPMPTLAKLNLPLGQRIATIALFSLGLVVIAVGVVRCYWIYDVVVLDMADFTWEGANHSYNVWIWTALECNLAINCGSIPRRRPGPGHQAAPPAEYRRPDGLDFCDYGMGGTTRTTPIVAEPPAAARPRTATSSASVKTTGHGSYHHHRAFVEDEERQDAAALEEFLGRAGRRWGHTVGLGRRDAPPRVLLSRPGGGGGGGSGFELDMDDGAPRRHTTGNIRGGLPRVTTDITVVHSGKPG